MTEVLRRSINIVQVRSLTNLKPVNFDEMNKVIGEDQPEYLPLPALVKPYAKENGDVYPGSVVVSCWELTDEEMAEIVKTKKVYLSVLTFGQPVQPCFLTAKKEEVI